jgi:hypothetical protein
MKCLMGIIYKENYGGGELRQAGWLKVQREEAGLQALLALMGLGRVLVNQ